MGPPKRLKADVFSMSCTSTWSQPFNALASVNPRDAAPSTITDSQRVLGGDGVGDAVGGLGDGGGLLARRRWSGVRRLERLCCCEQQRCLTLAIVVAV